jgi:hypothetical protein
MILYKHISREQVILAALESPKSLLDLLVQQKCKVANRVVDVPLLND